MKTEYIAPTMEIIEFETEDVITASGGTAESSETIVLPPMPLG